METLPSTAVGSAASTVAGSEPATRSSGTPHPRHAPALSATGHDSLRWLLDFVNRDLAAATAADFKTLSREVRSFAGQPQLPPSAKRRRIRWGAVIDEVSRYDLDSLDVPDPAPAVRKIQSYLRQGFALLVAGAHFDLPMAVRQGLYRDQNRHMVIVTYGTSVRLFFAAVFNLLKRDLGPRLGACAAPG